MDDHVSASYRKKLIPVSLTEAILRGEQAKLYRRFETLVSPKPEWKVLDLGVNGAPDSREASFFENLYPWPEKVVAAGVEAPGPFAKLFPTVRYVQTTRGSELPFAADEFDLIFCSAVIEHVGARSQQRAFLKEITRVAPRAFLTTPNRWYPVELHTVTPLLHWLPHAVHRPLLRRLGFDFFSREENLNLLDRRAFSELVPPGVRFDLHSHAFLGLTSNLLMLIDR